jgi:hypothetical protein
MAIGSASGMLDGMDAAVRIDPRIEHACRPSCEIAEIRSGEPTRW